METVEIERKNLHHLQCSLFAEAVRTGTAPPYGFREGKQMLAVTEAIVRSIDTGQVVPVSYDF